MHPLRWFDTTPVDAFATEIADEFANIYPSESKTPVAERARRLEQAITTLGNRAAKYHQQHRLGWYRKARFASALRERLEARGHGKDMVEGVVYKVLLRMAR